MASESLTYVIDAEDNASVKFQKLKNQLDNNVKSVKEFGGKAKIATEFTGSLASVLGDSKFAGAAGMFAGLTEKTSQLSEVMKQGGAGAMAFKVGVAAAAGALVYQLTHSIASSVVGLDELEKKLQSLKGQFANTVSSTQAVLRESLAIDAELASLSGAREGFVFFDGLTKKIQQLRDELAETNKEKNPEFAESLRAEIRIYENQRNAISKLSDARVIEINKIKERQQAEQSSLNFLDQLETDVRKLTMSQEQLDELTAATNTHNQEAFDQAMQLLKVKRDHMAELEREKELAELEKQNAKSKVDNTKKVFEAQKSIVENLRQQLTLQKDGSVAARAFALEQQGVGSQMAKMFAEFEDQLAGLGNQAKEMSPSSNTASESRLMSGVQTIDQRAIEAKRLAEINLEQKQVMQQMDKKLAAIEFALKAPQIVVGT